MSGRYTQNIDTSQKPSDSVMLQFLPISVVIDNPSSKWLFFEAIGAWTPPGIHGQVIQWTSKLPSSTVDTTLLPQGQTALPLVDSNVMIQYTTDIIPPTAGTPYGAPFTENGIVLDYILSGDSTTHSFQMPAGIGSIRALGSTSTIGVSVHGIVPKLDPAYLWSYLSGNKLTAVDIFNGNMFSSSTVPIIPGTSTIQWSATGNAGAITVLVGYPSPQPTVVEIANGFSPVYVAEFGPANVNGALAGQPETILGGSAGATVAGATLITIPAGRTWRGSVGCCVIAAGKCTVQTIDSQVTPAAGTIIVEAGMSTAVGSYGRDRAENIYVSAGSGNSVRLVAYAPAATADAYATGVLLQS